MDSNSVEPQHGILAPPSPLNLAAFLPFACMQMQMPFKISVVTEVQDEYVSKSEEKPKRTNRAKSIVQTSHTMKEREVDADENKSSSEDHFDIDHSPIVMVKLTMDPSGRTVGLLVERGAPVPRLLLRLIALIIPFHSHLTQFTIHGTPTDGVILYELAKLLPVSHLTDICLDDTPVQEGNYHVLLATPAQLQQLTLCRCRVGDAGAESLASQLVHPLPAAKTLITLALASNGLTDKGAQSFAYALRSNRTLQHLNLAGNQITDDGACDLFSSLRDFPLTYDELLSKRRRHIKFIEDRRAVYQKCLRELATAMAEKGQDDSSRSGKRKLGRSRKTSGTGPSLGVSVLSGVLPTSNEALLLKAEAMASDLMGSYTDPFSNEDTMIREGYVYSHGNMVLCYLNMAYNSLTFISLRRLLDVVTYQSGVSQRPNAAGLMRVSLEGNDLPVACLELMLLQDQLERVVMEKAAKMNSAKKAPKPKTRATINY